MKTEQLVISEIPQTLEQRIKNIRQGYLSLLDEKGYLQLIQSRLDSNPNSIDPLTDNSGLSMINGLLFWIRDNRFEFHFSTNKTTTRFSTQLGDHHESIHLYPHRIKSSKGIVDFPEMPLVSFFSYVESPIESSFASMIKAHKARIYIEDKDALIEGYNMLQQLKVLMPHAKNPD